MASPKGALKAPDVEARIADLENVVESLVIAVLAIYEWILGGQVTPEKGFPGVITFADLESDGTEAV